MKKLKSIIILSFILLLSSSAFSQGIVVPNGTGAYGNMIYAGVGLVSPKQYDSKSNFVGSFGLGIGDPVKGLGFDLGSSMLNYSSSNMYNAGVKVHRYLAKGIYVAGGVENLLSFRSTGGRVRGITNVYLTFSQYLSQVTTSPLLSRFSYTLGAGNGRFANLSVLDSHYADGRKGTYAFGALACRLTNAISGHVEWSGTNMNSGISVNGKLFGFPFSIMCAATNLTSYSSDKFSFVGGVGTVYKLNDKPSEKEELLDKILENQEKEMLSKLLDNPQQDQSDSLQKLQDKVKELQNELDNCNKNKADLQDKLNKGNANNSNYNNADNVVNHQGDNVSKFDPKTRINSNVAAGYYVVIHSFRYEKQAIRATEIEKKKNVDSQILNNKTRKLYYVYTEYFKNLKEALKQSKVEREKGHVGTWVHIY